MFGSHFFVRQNDSKILENLANQVLNVLKYQIVDITSRLTPQPSGSGGGGGTSSSIAKAESIGRSITSILGNTTSSTSNAEISGGASSSGGAGGGGGGGAGPSTSALPPMQQVPLVRKGMTARVCVRGRTKTTTEIFSSLFSSSLQSLKKEIDWDRADDKESASSDFRHPSLADLVSCVCVCVEQRDR